MGITSKQYHQETSYQRNKMGGHFLDWENQPTVFKVYPGVTPIHLPREVGFPETTLFKLFKEDHTKSGDPLLLAIEDLSLILLLTYSLTAKTRNTNGEFYYRNAASAGALYPTEIYVAARGVNGLEDGVYHFSIAQHALSLLRRGDLSFWIYKAVKLTSTKAPILTFFFSAIFFRSAWKYRERSYRYHLLDTGHVLENMVLALKALGLPFSLLYDFEDHGVNHLLGLDDSKEVCLAFAQIPGTSTARDDSEGELAEISEPMRTASRVAHKEINYPIIQKIHMEGVKPMPPSESLIQMHNELGVNPDTWSKIHPPETWFEATGYAETLFRRRSRRNFVPEPIPRGSLSALLDALCKIDSEENSNQSNYHQSVATGFIVNRAGDFEPGLYLLDRCSGSYGTIFRESIIDKVAHICLDQTWLTNAGVHFVFMTNLHTLDHVWGTRGYRYAMMTAGRLGERLYLAAEAMGLGCCGIGAFYDFEAAECLGLNAESRLLYLVAVGAVKAKLL